MNISEAKLMGMDKERARMIVTGKETPRGLKEVLAAYCVALKHPELQCLHGRRVGRDAYEMAKGGLIEL